MPDIATHKGRYVTLSGMTELVTIKAPRTAVSVSGSVVIPAAIADAGEHVEAFFDGCAAAPASEERGHATNEASDADERGTDDEDSQHGGRRGRSQESGDRCQRTGLSPRAWFGF